jgi:hypothetical protein
MLNTTEEMTAEPFRAAADYIAAGWAPLWLPPRTKTLKAKGVSGSSPDASPEQLAEWARDPRGNIAIRLPPDVVGIDVDHYGDKRGGDALAALEAELGPLPETVISSSRDDGVSGIRLYRASKGLKWKGKPVPGIDILHHGYRYALVWPSIHDKTGQTYRWRGAVNGHLPTPRELPELPFAWVEYLTDDPAGEVDDAAIAQILTDGEPCSMMRRAVAGYRARVEEGQSRHEAMLAASMAILGAGQEGHAGTMAAIEALGEEFTGEVDRPDAADEFRRAVDGAVEKLLAEPFEGKRSCCKLTVIKFSDPEDEFWNARPRLATIRQFAKARLMPPWGVLGGVLGQVVAATPPNVCLPPIIGGKASLNLFLAFVGGSGDGKGASIATAKDAIIIPKGQRAETFLPGSGEGLVGMFAVKEKVDGEWQTVRIRDRALVDVPEVDALAALGAGRSGATILPFLRSAWTGEAIGRTNATAERNVSIDAHSYRAVMLVGVQPERAEVLINDTAGTAQRFVWLPMTDPHPVDVEEPPPITWMPPSGSRGSEHVQQLVSFGERQIKVCDRARDEIREARKARLRGAGHTLDGQAMLSKLKLAAALAILEGRYEVREDDWDLAGFAMQKSDETRSAIEDHLRDRAARQSAARGKAAGVQKVAADETEHDIKTQAAAKAIRHQLEGRGWRGRSDLRRAISRTHRPYFDDAITALLAAGIIEERSVDGQGQPGTEYRLKP